MKFERELMLNVSSKEACSILNGDMTALLRKNLPKNFKEGWVYLYCTKAKPYLLDFGDNEYPYNNGGFELSNIIDDNIIKHGADILNGKVVARFWFDEYSELMETWTGDEYVFQKQDEMDLDDYEIIEYLGNNPGYLLHIKNLEIFDKPKELSDFYIFRKEWVHCGLDCPPYVDEVKYKMKRVYSAWQYAYRQV